MPEEKRRPLYRRIAEVGDDKKDVEPLVRELELRLLQPEEAQGASPEDPWGADACFEKLASRPRQSTLALALWLTDEQHAQLGKRLFRKLSARDFSAKLTIPDTAGLEAATVALCAARLCAMGTSPMLSLAWTLALAARPLADEEAQLAARSLMRHLVGEFPNTTRKLLEAIGPEPLDIKLASDALEHLQAQSKLLTELSELSEFSMSKSMSIALSRQRLRQHREIHRNAEGRSVLASLFTQHHLKYANSTSVEMSVGGEIKEQTLSMAPHSFSYELPLSEALDPQTGWLRREELWRGHFR